MPLYEYECAKCGERTEAIQRHGDALLTVCPACGGALVKLLSAPAFQFKGSGFYLTDYGKAGAKTGEKEKSSSKGEEGGGASESKGAGAGESTKEDSSKDSAKGEKDGAAGAAPATSTGAPAPSPSRKKDGKTK
jgi:putative FmdB family regulatory protein